MLKSSENVEDKDPSSSVQYSEGNTDPQIHIRADFVGWYQNAAGQSDKKSETIYTHVYIFSEQATIYN